MNLALSEDQRMIRDAAASFLADASAPAAVRAAMGSDRAFDAKLWQGIGEMGWCGTAIPEGFGGMGLGPQELVLIFEQLSRGCIATAAFLSIHNMCTWMIDTFGSDELRARFGFGEPADALENGLRFLL